VFACTTSERVAGFFERNGFARVGADEIPAEKWRDYDPARRARVLCLLRDLA
jgi:N-acetylglutamate synthase-like GNAT family acetyltransferase